MAMGEPAGMRKPDWPSGPEFIKESEVNWVGPKPNDGIPKIKFITFLGILGFIAYSILLLYIGGRLS